MNIQLFEQLCHDCCFSQDYEAKQQAEKSIYSFIEDIRNANQVTTIIQSSLQSTTLFVLSEYIVKIILSERSFKGFSSNFVSGDITIMSGQCYSNEEISMLQQKCQYFQTLATFMCQALQRQVENHVSNSICNLVGLLVQQVMMISGQPQSCDKFVGTLFQPFFTNHQNSQQVEVGLKLIKNTIINIQQYNYYDSYVSYRRIMSQFQLNDVLQFMQILGMIIISNNPPLIKPSIVCLKEVLMFNFNVSYFELEADFDPNDQNNVNFPDKFAEYFADPILIKFLFTCVKEYNQIDQTLALSSLKCLKRMGSARKRVFLEKIKRRQYAKEMFGGTIYLFENIQDSNENIMSDILELNNKLCLNLGLRQIRFDYQFITNWLYSLQNYCIGILKKQIKIKDNHIKQMMELMKRLIKSVTDFKLDTNFKSSITKTIGEVGKAIMHILLNSQQSFFMGYNPQNFKKLKHALKDFFDQLFPILQIDLLNHLKMIHHSFQSICANQVDPEKFIIELSMINYIVINPQILERQACLQMELGADGTQIILQIIDNSLNFIKYTQNIPSINPLILMSVMSLAENLLQYSLSEIDESIGRQRNQKQFFSNFIMPLQKYANSTTDLLLNYICSTLNIENKEIILYALCILKETVVRLKHHLFSEIFQNLSITANIQQVLLNLKNTALQKTQFFSCRTQSAEILSILLLDSTYENYIQSIIALNDLLPLQPTRESIEIYLFEMLGYFRYVDVSRIFRLLIKQHQSKLIDLNRYILIDNPNQFDLCKLCLKVMVAITDNKNLRFQYHSSSIVQIQLVRAFQTILTQYCQHLLNAISEDTIKSFSSQICRLLGLVFKIINNILKGKYISQACQLLFSDRNYLDLLIVVIDLASVMSNYMILYNKSCVQMVQVLQIVSFSQLQLFELNPQSFTKLLQVVQVLQHHLLDTLSEEYRVISTVTYHQVVDKVSLEHTTEILANTLEFVSEEQQLASMGMVTLFVQPLDSIIEIILKDLFTCLLKGQCSQQTEMKVSHQLFAILCTYQQTFIKMFNYALYATYQVQTEYWRQLVIDLDLRLKLQNLDQFRINLKKFLTNLDIRAN